MVLDINQRVNKFFVSSSPTLRSFCISVKQKEKLIVDYFRAICKEQKCFLEPLLLLN